MDPNPMRTVYRNYTPQAAAVHDADSDEEGVGWVMDELSGVVSCTQASRRIWQTAAEGAAGPWTPVTPDGSDAAAAAANNNSGKMVKKRIGGVPSLTCEETAAAMAKNPDDGANVNWHDDFPQHVAAASALGAYSTTAAVAQAEAGLAKLHEELCFIRGNRQAPVLEVCRHPSLRRAMLKRSEIATVEINGDMRGSPRAFGGPPIGLPICDSYLTGERFCKQVDLWVSYGAAEPSVAESVRAALGCPRELQPKGNSDLDNASDGEDDAVASEATIAVSAQADDEKATKAADDAGARLDAVLQGRIFVCLGATCSIGPAKVLLALGATVAAVARPGKKLNALIDFARASPGRLLLPKITEARDEKEVKSSKKDNKDAGDKGKQGEGVKNDRIATEGKTPSSADTSQQPEPGDDNDDDATNSAAGLNMLTQTPECAQWLLQVAAGLALDAASAQRGAARAEAQVRRASVEAAVAAARATQAEEEAGAAAAARGAATRGADATAGTTTKKVSGPPEANKQKSAEGKPTTRQEASSSSGLPSVSLVVCPGATGPGEVGVRLAGASDALIAALYEATSPAATAKRTNRQMAAATAQAELLAKKHNLDATMAGVPVMMTNTPKSISEDDTVNRAAALIAAALDKEEAAAIRRDREKKDQGGKKNSSKTESEKTESSSEDSSSTAPSTTESSPSSSSPFSEAARRELVSSGGLAGQVAVELSCLISPHAALLWPSDAKDDAWKRWEGRPWYSRLGFPRYRCSVLESGVEAPPKKRKPGTAKEPSEKISVTAEDDTKPHQSDPKVEASSSSAAKVETREASEELSKEKEGQEVAAGEEHTERTDESAAAAATTPQNLQQQQRQPRRRKRREVFRGAVPRRGPVVTITDQVPVWRAILAQKEATQRQTKALKDGTYPNAEKRAFVGTVSANVAPPSRSPTATKVLLDRAFLDGIQNFDCMLVLEPPAAATVMTLLLCNDLARADENARASSSAATSPEMHAHPMELFSHAALHGGSWRSPYARYPAVGRTATTLGLLAPFRFSAALLES